MPELEPVLEPELDPAPELELEAGPELDPLDPAGAPLEPDEPLRPPDELPALAPDDAPEPLDDAPEPLEPPEEPVATPEPEEDPLLGGVSEPLLPDDPMLPPEPAPNPVPGPGDPLHATAASASHAPQIVGEPSAAMMWRRTRSLLMVVPVMFPTTTQGECASWSRRS
jgi:periplasmic protein TonB